MNEGTTFNDNLFATALDLSTLNATGFTTTPNTDLRFMDNTNSIILALSGGGTITGGTFRTYIQYYSPNSKLPNITYVPPPPPAGDITGSGTINSVPKFTAGTAIGNSSIEDNGTNITLGEPIISDSDTNESLDTNNRYTFDASGNPSILWDSRTLNLPTGSACVKWGITQLIDGTNNPSVDWSNYFLNVGVKKRIDWSAGQLFDFTVSNLLSVDWSARTLIDNAGFISVDWQDRLLKDDAGNNVADWTTPGVFDINGSVQTNAPAGGVSGPDLWQLGSPVVAASVLDTTRYVEVNIGGTIVKLAVIA
jgi:hypothetical protein